MKLRHPCDPIKTAAVTLHFQKRDLADHIKALSDRYDAAARCDDVTAMQDLGDQLEAAHEKLEALL